MFCTLYSLNVVAINIEYSNTCGGGGGGEAEVRGGPQGWAEAAQTSSSNSAVKGNQVNCEERHQQRSCFLIEVNVFNYG